MFKPTYDIQECSVIRRLTFFYFFFLLEHRDIFYLSNKYISCFVSTGTQNLGFFANDSKHAYIIESIPG